MTPICKIQSGIIRDIPDDVDHPANDNQQSADDQEALTAHDRELIRALAGCAPMNRENALNQNAMLSSSTTGLRDSLRQPSITIS